MASLDLNKSKFIEYYEKSIALTEYKKYDSIYYPYLIFNLIKILILENSIDDAFRYFNENIGFFSDFKDLYFLGAIINLHLKKYTLAKQYLEKYSTTKVLHNFYPSSNLNQVFKVEEIIKQININSFIEGNPVSNERMSLTIVIMGNDSGIDNSFKKCLMSIKGLNCDKIILTSNPLINSIELEKHCKVSLLTNMFIEDPLNKRECVENYIKTIYKNSWFLLLYENEMISYSGLLKLQVLIKEKTQFNTFFLQIVKKGNKEKISFEKRLFKISNLPLVTYDKQNEISKGVDIAIISL